MTLFWVRVPVDLFVIFTSDSHIVLFAILDFLRLKSESYVCMYVF